VRERAATAHGCSGARGRARTGVVGRGARHVRVRGCVRAASGAGGWAGGGGGGGGGWRGGQGRRGEQWISCVDLLGFYT
jgi:hypothetical protein